MMVFNSEDLMNIAFDEIEEAVDSLYEDCEIVNRVRGVVCFVNRMRNKEREDKA